MAKGSMDRYKSYQHLKAGERQGVDYRIRRRAGSTGITILSIHGGDIEPGTSCIADAIAGPDHAFYAFEGIKDSGNLALHITSTHFDEPGAIDLIRGSWSAVTIHGCARLEPLVHVGGLDFALRDRVIDALRRSGFTAIASAKPPFGGMDRDNICNLCSRGMGVQIEISRGLRAGMFSDLSPEGRRFPTQTLAGFAQAVRQAISAFAVAMDSPDPHGRDKGASN